MIRGMLTPISRRLRPTTLSLVLMVDLGTLGGSLAEAKGISADGSVVVGGSNIAGDSVAHAFRWTSAGMVDLGTLGGSVAEANAVSADGSVIVGYSQNPGSADPHAFR
jgi:probable HAF family extracellular repeat protein